MMCATSAMQSHLFYLSNSPLYNGCVLSHYNFLTHKFPQYPLKNLCLRVQSCNAFFEILISPELIIFHEALVVPAFMTLPTSLSDYEVFTSHALRPLCLVAATDPGHGKIRYASILRKGLSCNNLEKIKNKVNMRFVVRISASATISS